jgi:branched-chain amino acid transport system permease protein
MPLPHPQVLANGLLLGALHGCAAMGLQFMLGTTGRVHLAYGHVTVVAALAGTGLAMQATLPLWGAALCVALLAAAVGAGLHPSRLWSSSRVGAHAERAFLLVGLGAALVLEDVGHLFWPLPVASLGPGATPWRLAGIVLAPAKLTALAAALSLAGVVWLFLTRTRNGKALRAWQGGAGMVQLMGASPPRLGRQAMGLGFGIAGLAGAMLAVTQVVSVQEGMALTVRWLCLAILAGALSPWRVLAGGALLGAGEGGLGQICGTQWGAAWWYGLLLAILFWRAQRQRP